MEAIKGLPKALPAVLGPSQQAFGPLLQKNASTINGVERNTFQYGNTPRQALDVYYPSANASGTKVPVLHYSYGGGFVMGSRQTPNPLMLANVGAFFAHRGILTVISDYRLVPDGARFPSGPQDIGKSVEWCKTNLSNVADVSRIFILGVSAGAIHATNFVFSSQFEDIASHVKGLITVGAAFALADTLPFYKSGETYFGGQDGLQKHLPASQLASSSRERVAKLPPLHIVYAENDPDEILTESAAFASEWEQKGGKVSKAVAAGHNHISITLALSSGEGEQWAEEVSALITNKA